MIGIVDRGAKGHQSVAADDFQKSRKHGLGQLTVLSDKGLPDFLPSSEVSKVAHAVLKNEKSPFEIERRDHLQNQVGILGILRAFEHIEELLSAKSERIALDRIDRQMRREVGELWPRAGIRVRADDDRHRGRLQMEKGMDARTARNNRHRGAFLQKMRFLEIQVSDAKVGGDGLGILKSITRVNARTLHHMKGPGELVLMDVGGPVEPEEGLDVKLRVVIDNQLRLAKGRRGLEG